MQDYEVLYKPILKGPSERGQSPCLRQMSRMTSFPHHINDGSLMTTLSFLSSHCPQRYLYRGCGFRQSSLRASTDPCPSHTGHPRAVPDKRPWAISGSLWVLYIWRDSSSSAVTTGLGGFRPQKTRLKAENVHKCGRLAENPIPPIEGPKDRCRKPLEVAVCRSGASRP